MIGPIDGVRLLDGEQRACWWKPPADPGCRKRTASVTCIVLHWTGGEGGHEQIHRTLATRRLSIHFTIAQDGSVMQHADPVGTVCSHAGGTMNGRSVGIEITNAGFPPAHEKWPRQKLPARIHGRQIMTLGFYAAQTAAALALTKHLCALFGLPFAVPRTADGAVVGDVMPRDARLLWRGVLGHLQISAEKADPGIALLDAVR